MARTRRADYQRSNRIRTLPLHDPEAAALATQRLLRALDAPGRLRLGAELLAVLSAQAGIGAPELVVPDEDQPHRRSGGRPLGRIRVLNRTPARGDVVRPTAFLHTLLHEFCHHHDAERLGILHSFHTSGFYARLRHVRDQIEAGRGDGLDEAHKDAARAGRSAPPPLSRRDGPLPLLERLWSIIRAR